MKTYLDFKVKKIRIPTIFSIQLLQNLKTKDWQQLKNQIFIFNKQTLEDFIQKFSLKQKKESSIFNKITEKSNNTKFLINESTNQQKLIEELNKQRIYLFIGETKLSLYEKFGFFLKKQEPVKTQLLLVKPRSHMVNGLDGKLKNWKSVIFFTQDEEGFFKGDRNRVRLADGGIGNRRYITKILVRPYYKHYDEDDGQTYNFKREVPQGLQFHSSKFYYPENNQGGFKSICPIFFDFTTAEEFLCDAMENDVELLSNITTEGTYVFPHIFLDGKWPAKIILHPLLRSEIITVGLGDFLRYYSQFDYLKNKDTINSLNPLNQIEFLFIPNPEELVRLEKINIPKRILKKIFFFLPKKWIKLKQPLSFNDCKKLYYSLEQ